MKKNGILNSEISDVLSRMGHYDTIAIADCGLPIPNGVKRIDIALAFQRPGFIETLEVLLSDFQYQHVILAEEIKNNQDLLRKIQQWIPEDHIHYMPHEDFKTETQKCKAIIRTGEIIPYANMILASGVIF